MMPHEALVWVLGPDLYSLSLAAVQELYIRWEGPDGDIGTYFTEGLARILSLTLASDTVDEARLSETVVVPVVSSLILSPEPVRKVRSLYRSIGNPSGPITRASFAEGGVSIEDAATLWSRDWAGRYGN